MARRRMIAREVVSSDEFLGMSIRARELYVHLNLAGDDDGFVSNVDTTVRMVGASKKHLRELLDKGYLIRFDSGICLVTHWRVANTIRKDLYHSSLHREEAALVTEIGGVYRLLTEEELAQRVAGEAEAIPEGDASVTETTRERNEDVTEALRESDESVTQLDENKLKLDKDNQKREGKDQPSLIIPSEKELLEYAESIGYQDFNPEKFLTYYGSRNWTLSGGMPVTDWRMQVDSWKAREGDYKPAAPSSKQIASKPANQHDYDFEELEKKLIAN
ncbi:MAG: hypothetical protein K6F31_12425 [Acetatifactor sp.]|nr:hypothetical protein [Acetatifactor sp.]